MAWDAPTRVARTYYGLTGLWTLSASLIWGVNTLFMLDAGLPIFHVFVANAAFTAGQVLFEIPTGVVADTRGRRISFLMAVVTVLAGTLWYVYLWGASGSLAQWIAASILLGLGFTFYSGAVEAWFVDALADVGGPKDLDPYFARGGQIFSAGMLVGTVSGGLLGQLDLSYPYLVRAVMLVALLAVGFMLMHDRGFTVRRFKLRAVPHEIGNIARASWKHGWQKRPVRLLMLIAFVHFGFLIWGWYAWQPYFLELLGRDIIWVAGVIAALVSALMIAGNQLVRLLHGKMSRPTMMIVASAGLAVCMIGVGASEWLVARLWPAAPGLAPFFFAVSLFLLGMVFFGLVSPARQAALHALIPSEQRATITSFDGLLGSAGGVGSQIALARVAQDKGWAAGYLIGGVALTAAIPIAFLFRRTQGAGGPPLEEAHNPAGLPGDSEE